MPTVEPASISRQFVVDVDVLEDKRLFHLDRGLPRLILGQDYIVSLLMAYGICLVCSPALNKCSFMHLWGALRSHKVLVIGNCNPVLPTERGCHAILKVSLHDPKKFYYLP